jgi:hypothetical protein
MPEELSEGEAIDQAVPPSGPAHAWLRLGRRRRVVLVACIAAVVVAVVAVVAIAAGSAAQGPQYASPRNVCDLVRTGTLAKYLPGPDEGSDSAVPSLNAVGHSDPPTTCWWFTVSGFLTVVVSVYSSPDDGAAAAQQSFNASVQADDHGTTTDGTRMTVTGQRSVAGLGDQATALLATSDNPAQGNNGVSDYTNLFVRSGNAVIDVQYSVSLPSAQQIPGAVAIARDVVTRLPRA